jgi:hypothetical protein
MTTTQSLAVAMFMPVTPPTTGEAIIVTAVNPTSTTFEPVVGGALVPTATVQGQVMIAGAAPNFAWGLTMPGTFGVTTFEGRGGDVTLLSADVVTALGYTPYSNANPSGYQTASQVNTAIGAAVAQPSGQAPLMDGAAVAGTLALYARGDHVHPSDTSRYAASNPAGYQTAAQVTAVLPVVPPSSNATPLMDGTAAPGSVLSWARADHVHPTDTSRYAASNPAGYQTAAQVTAAFPPASILNPLMDGIPNYGSATSWSRGDHVHPSDTSRYPTTNPAGYQTAQDVLNAIAGIGGGSTPSNLTPLMDGAAAAGTLTPYARGDHVHPSDTSRAPIANPIFTGTVTLAQNPTQPLQAVTMQYVTTYGIDCGTY